MNQVYAYASTIDGVKCVKEINSSLFLVDSTGWVEIDKGEGDRYAHAQGNYLEMGNMVPLLDDEGRYNYKLEDGTLVLMNEEEKAQVFPPAAPAPSLEERISNQEQATLALMDTILMMNGGNGNV